MGGEAWDQPVELKLLSNLVLAHSSWNSSFFRTCFLPIVQVNFPLELVSKDGKKASLTVSVLAIEALHRLSQSTAS